MGRMGLMGLMGRMGWGGRGGGGGFFGWMANGACKAPVGRALRARRATDRHIPVTGSLEEFALPRGAVAGETTKGRNDESTKGNAGGPGAHHRAAGVCFSNGWKKRRGFFQSLEKRGGAGRKA